MPTPHYTFSKRQRSIFGLGLAAARAIIKEVAAATAPWREVATQAGAKNTEITRMASAFEHDDLERAKAL